MDLFASAPPLVPVVAKPGRRVLFCCLNGSTASAEKDDPTLRRMVGFARIFGALDFSRRSASISTCGRYRYSLQRGDLEVVNMYGWRATDPFDLQALDEATRIGPDNDAAILEAAQRADVTIAGWGASLPSDGEKRAREVWEFLRRFGPVWCLGLTRAGFPRHPLYLPAGSPLVRFEPRTP